MPETSRSPDAHAFAFFGAGEASYFEWAEVHVRFASAPGEDAKRAIAGRVPPPLRDSIDWQGADLVVASDQMAHATIAEAYAADPDDTEDPNEELEEDSHFFFAKTSQVRKFNADIEAWLRLAHESWPIRAAYRAEDAESGGTELSAWHRWSLERLADVLPHFEDVLASEADDAPGAYMLAGILAMAREAKPRPKVPRGFFQWLDAADDVDKALDAHDAAKLRALLTGRFGPRAVRQLTSADTEDADLLRTLWAARDLLAARPDLPGGLLVRLATASACFTPESERATALDDLFRRALEEGMGDELAAAGYALAMRREFLPGLAMFDRIVDLPDLELSAYCNALWIVQADNNKLPVDAPRLRRYLEACLPHAPDNPAIYHNAAYCFLELGDEDGVCRMFQAAVSASYEGLAAMRADALFAPLATKPRFREIFAAIDAGPKATASAVDDDGVFRGF